MQWQHNKIAGGCWFAPMPFVECYKNKSCFPLPVVTDNLASGRYLFCNG